MNGSIFVIHSELMLVSASESKSDMIAVGWGDCVGWDQARVNHERSPDKSSEEAVLNDRWPKALYQPILQLIWTLTFIFARIIQGPPLFYLLCFWCIHFPFSWDWEILLRENLKFILYFLADLREFLALSGYVDGCATELQSDRFFVTVHDAVMQAIKMRKTKPSDSELKEWSVQVF